MKLEYVMAADALMPSRRMMIMSFYCTFGHKRIFKLVYPVRDREARRRGPRCVC